MIVDSSVVTSIFLRRPGHERLIDALAGAGRAGIGAPTLAEANAEISRATGADLEGLVSRFLQEFGVEVVPFGESHSRAAVDAWRRYGGGHGRAGLDLGGCLVYATARLARRPLLTADPRFARTDLELAALRPAS